jgi:hypothetical protein
MPTAHKAEYGVVIYLRGGQDMQLDDAERRCREYASRFGWRVLESIRDDAASATSGQLVAKLSRPGAAIVLTDTLDMISSDQAMRDDLILTIERTGRIVHPVTTPCRRQEQ